MRFLPFTPGILALAVAAIVLALNLGVQALGYGPMKLAPGVAGQTVTQALPWSFAAIAKGDTAAAVGLAIGRWMPLFPQAVRLRSQIYYSLYGVSPLPYVILGNNHELLERPYLLDWCSRDVAAWRPGAVQWAASIRHMQDLVEQRGQRFLYVLTPSKVAQYPGFVPAGYGCPSRPADREGLLPEWRQIVRQAGIHFADVTLAIAEARPNYLFPLFPPGGTHLNELGQAIGMQAVMGTLDVMMPGRGFGGLGYTWDWNLHASGDDVDLARPAEPLHGALGGCCAARDVQPIPTTILPIAETGDRGRQLRPPDWPPAQPARLPSPSHRIRVLAHQPTGLDQWRAVGRPGRPGATECCGGRCGYSRL